MTDIKVALNDSSKLEVVIQGLKFADGNFEEQTVSCYNSVKAANKGSNISDASSGALLTTNNICLTCKCEFLERADQVAHYRSDWHQYNLKLHLINKATVSEERFIEIADTLSISGSDSDSSSDEEEIIETSTSVLKQDSEESVKFYDDRRPKFYFRNENDEIVSVFKKVLCNKQVDVTGSSIHSLLIQLLNDVRNCYWLIILFNAGHFAAAVFDGKATVLTHKTFHRYIVRAKRGTVQSLNDSSNRGHTAKSAGASLRRHNEAALEESIKSLIRSWKEEYIEKCSHIFLRIPHYRKALFYGGKEPLFDHNDQRLRSIPFVTRRPTFNEVKRVHKELFHVTLHANTNLSDLLSKPNTKQTSEQYSEAAAVIIETKELNNKEPDSTDVAVQPDTTLLNKQHIAEEMPTPKQKPKKKRKPKDKSKTVALEQAEQLNEPDSFDDTIQLSVEEQRLMEKLYTACKTTDGKMLTEILQSQFCSQCLLTNHSFANSTESNIENEDLSTEKCNSSAEIQKGRTKLLSLPLDKSGDTLLHIVSRVGDKAIILKLLDCGADPAIKNASFHTPYSVCSNKEAKNTYRRFRAKYPDMYDYNKAQVASPLSEELEAEVKKKQAEKKRAQKAAKRERGKKAREEEKRQEEENERKLKEQSEKDRFLALSDREKRLIAVERRLVNQPHAQLTRARRCYSCAESLFAKVPFEYFDFQFCSVNCLKLHKAKSKS